MKWCDRSLWYCRYNYGLCMSEKDFHRQLKRMGLPRDTWPSFMNEGANATTHFFNHPDGDRAAIVCMGDRSQINGVQTAALLVHEAVHIWQEHRAAVGEREPSDESEAYAVQSISQRLMEAYAETIQ